MIMCRLVRDTKLILRMPDFEIVLNESGKSGLIEYALSVHNEIRKQLPDDSELFMRCGIRIQGCTPEIVWNTNMIRKEPEGMLILEFAKSAKEVNDSEETKDVQPNEHWR